jgi:hypothetical protein
MASSSFEKGQRDFPGSRRLARREQHAAGADQARGHRLRRAAAAGEAGRRHHGFLDERADRGRERRDGGLAHADLGLWGEYLWSDDRIESGFHAAEARGGSGLRRCLHLPITGHRHPRQANCPRLALAERLRRKTDRIDPTRVCRPYCRPGRTINLTVRRLLVAQKADVRVPLRRHWTRAKVQYALAVLCLHRGRRCRDPSFICSSFWLPHLRRAQQQLPISR